MHYVRGVLCHAPSLTHLDAPSRPLLHRTGSPPFWFHKQRDGVLMCVLLPDVMPRMRNGVSKPDMAYVCAYLFT